MTKKRKKTKKRPAAETPWLYLAGAAIRGLATETARELFLAIFGR